MMHLSPPPRVASAALPFQSDLDRLIAQPTPPFVRFWPAMGFGLLAALTLAAALFPIDIVVTAQGRITTDAPPILLRPSARAALTELLVKPGDVVQKGQVLARLDATLPQADLAALSSEKRSLTAEIARIQAELSGQTMPTTGPELVAQQSILARRTAEKTASLAAYDAAIAALQNQQAALAKMTPSVNERVSIAQQIEAMQDELARRNAAAPLAVLTARAARLTAEQEAFSHQSQLADVARQLGAAQDQRAIFLAQSLRDASETLPKLLLRLSQVQDALSKAERITALTEITAPRAGVVISLAPGGVGAIVTEGDPLISIVPTDTGLLADISIASSDLGRVAIGDPVALKIDAFPFRKFGSLKGKITSIGPVSSTPEGAGEAVHPARVALQTPAQDLPSGMTLASGMTLSAEVWTGTRSVLDYFLDPIERGLSESLREP